MFGRKKKNTARFGKNIEESCAYCMFNASGSADEAEVICTVNGQIKNGKCRKYRYNPLMRAPRRKIEVRSDFSEEDFKIE